MKPEFAPHRLCREIAMTSNPYESPRAVDGPAKVVRRAVNDRPWFWKPFHPLTLLCVLLLAGPLVVLFILAGVFMRF